MTCILCIAVLVLLIVCFGSYVPPCTSMYTQNFSRFFPVNCFRWWSSPNPLSYCPLNVVPTPKAGTCGSFSAEILTFHTSNLCNDVMPPPLFGLSVTPSAQRPVWISKAAIKDKNNVLKKRNCLSCCGTNMLILKRRHTVGALLNWVLLLLSTARKDWWVKQRFNIVWDVYEDQQMERRVLHLSVLMQSFQKQLRYPHQ